MMKDFDPLLSYFNQAFRTRLAHNKAVGEDVESLFTAMEYSAFNGGKRFRPLLCYTVGQALGISVEAITPLAMAVECIHTYSLIHDDLPCMDNDDFRRGQLTCHKQFNEPIALLAGDALLTEAFLILAQSYPNHSALLIDSLAKASGGLGMIRGQILDLGFGKKIDSLSDLIHLHECKTGELISVCFEGPALMAQKKSKPFKELGLLLGLAFQVKDDLLDAADEEPSSFIAFLGVQGTQEYLKSLTEKLMLSVEDVEISSPELISLIDFNLNRKV